MSSRSVPIEFCFGASASVPLLFPRRTFGEPVCGAVRAKSVPAWLSPTDQPSEAEAEGVTRAPFVGFWGGVGVIPHALRSCATGRSDNVPSIAIASSSVTAPPTFATRVWISSISASERCLLSVISVAHARL